MVEKLKSHKFMQTLPYLADIFTGMNDLSVFLRGKWIMFCNIAKCQKLSKKKQLCDVDE